jgi:hypothetical protein
LSLSDEPERRASKRHVLACDIELEEIETAPAVTAATPISVRVARPQAAE